MQRFWRVGIVAAVVLTFGGIAAGIVAAQSSGGTATPTGQSATASNSNATPTKKQQLIDDFLAKLAANLGISVDQLKQALTTTDNQLIAQAVADGKITQAEADKLKARIASGAQLLPFGGRGHGRGRGFGTVASLEAVATFLGITPQDVIAGLNKNQSLEQIAEAHGKAAGALSSYLYDQLKTRLDQAVKNSKITQAQENQMLSNAKDRINQMINTAGLPLGHWAGNKNMTPQGSPTGSPTETGSSL